MTDDAYLERFPIDHRASANQAYEDGFADGAGAEDERLNEVMTAVRALLSACEEMTEDESEALPAALNQAIADVIAFAAEDA